MNKFQSLINEGKKPPPQYDEIPDQPEVALHLTGLWSEFFELSTERQIGMAAGQIPASKIRDRARDLGIDDEADADRFYLLIRKMDAVYLAPKSEEPTVEASDGTAKPIVKFARKKLPHKKKL